MGIVCVLWEKYVEFKYEWVKITTAAIISPVLYLIAFGWGLGDRMVNGHPYIQFLIPGIIALSTMNTSYSSVGTSLNIQRLFEKSFKQIIISPTPWWQYLIGQIIGGAIRGMYAGILLLIIVMPFQNIVSVTPLFFLVMLLNGVVFSSLGVLASMIAKTHSDISRFSTFVIMPMTFLCNTFFPLEKVPKLAQTFINFLPLPHASGLLRAISYGEPIQYQSVVVLLAYAVVLFMLTLQTTQRIKNM